TRLIEAPATTVAAALRHTRTAECGAAPAGVRGQAGASVGELLNPGDELLFRVGAGGARLSLRTRVESATPAGVRSVGTTWPPHRLRHDSELREVGGHTLVTDSVEWSAFGLPRPFRFVEGLLEHTLARWLVLRVQQARLDVVRDLAETWAARPVVVGTAIVRNGQLLAQQRRYPARHAGQWELPGGRVESGETES